LPQEFLTVKTQDFIFIFIAQPELPEDVVALANWAYKQGYTLRARGHMHSWAPMTVTSTTSCSRVLLVDTTKHLTQMRINPINESDSYAPMSVNVQTGQNWEELLTYLESKGYGVFSFPAVGRMTLGGTLAVGAHGTGFPTKQTKISTGEERKL
jgi:FAD/FMN-containing dehydrogenase